MYCSHCKKEIPDNVVVCPVCGQKLRQEAFTPSSDSTSETSASPKSYCHVKVIKDKADFYRDYRYTNGYWPKAIAIYLVSCAMLGLFLWAIILLNLPQSDEGSGVMQIVLAIVLVLVDVVLIKSNHETTVAMRQEYVKYQARMIEKTDLHFVEQ